MICDGTDDAVLVMMDFLIFLYFYFFFEIIWDSGLRKREIRI